mmetsp:Transcript_19627/g.22627  ORF Transcript_19627/g.22627 Transcript_19627/m.22627 type:complete len:108 (-) Transcript_19627:84-407(-)
MNTYEHNNNNEVIQPVLIGKTGTPVSSIPNESTWKLLRETYKRVFTDAGYIYSYDDNGDDDDDDYDYDDYDYDDDGDDDKSLESLVRRKFSRQISRLWPTKKKKKKK